MQMDRVCQGVHIRGIQVAFSLGWRRVEGIATAHITDARIEEGSLVLDTGALLCENTVLNEPIGPVPEYLRGLLPPEDEQNRWMEEITRLRGMPNAGKQLSRAVTMVARAFQPAIDSYAETFWRQRAGCCGGENGLEEIRSAALEGFMTAVARWEPRSKTFQRLALPWIRYACLQEARALKAPVLKVNRHTIMRARHILHGRRVGGQAGAESVIKELGVDPCRKSPLIFLASVLDQPAVSFNDVTSRGGCKDSVIEDSPDYLARREVIEQLQGVLSDLPPREHYMFLLRYPFDGLVPPAMSDLLACQKPVRILPEVGFHRYLLKDIGYAFGFTKERARTCVDRVRIKIVAALKARGIDSTIFCDIANRDNDVTYFPEN